MFLSGEDNESVSDLVPLATLLLLVVDSVLDEEEEEGEESSGLAGFAATTVLGSTDLSVDSST
jgi:hypothetical protein